MQQQKSNISKNIEKKNKTHAPEKIMQQKKGTVVKKNCKKIKLNWILKNSNQ